MARNIKLFALGRMTRGALALALLLPAAYAQAKETMPAMQGSMAASSAMASGGMDMKAMMKDMSGKMSSMPMSGDPDADFAMMMRIHHQGAIDMANAELSNGKNPADEEDGNGDHRRAEEGDRTVRCLLGQTRPCRSQDGQVTRPREASAVALERGGANRFGPERGKRGLFTACRAAVTPAITPA